MAHENRYCGRMRSFCRGGLVAAARQRPGAAVRDRSGRRPDGRGVPLVELRTVSNVTYYTDSAGLAAIDDPAMMGQTVFFHVSSHGYEMAADGFGMRGRRLDVKPGGSAKIEIKRLNVAERLYRVTGEGMYRDSVILGRPVPIRRGLLNAQVTGQDSTQVAVYREESCTGSGATPTAVLSARPLRHVRGDVGATAGRGARSVGRSRPRLLHRRRGIQPAGVREGRAPPGLARRRCWC